MKFTVSCVLCGSFIVCAAQLLVVTSVAAQKSERPAKRKQKRPRGVRVPPGTQVDKDVVYESAGKRKLRLDLYRPAKSKKTARPLPLVIWIHGGGWKSGSKNNPGRAIGLLARGCAVASVEYRLSGEAFFPRRLRTARRPSVSCGSMQRSIISIRSGSARGDHRRAAIWSPCWGRPTTSRHSTLIK